MAQNPRPSNRAPHVAPAASRRDFLLHAGAGFGGVALSGMLAESLRAEAAASAGLTGASPSGSPLAAKKPPHLARAKRVIFLFMEGGPSHIDLFDPKPELEKLAGKPLPSSFKPVILAMGESNAPLLASKRTWKQYGDGGMWISDWLPHLAKQADKVCVIRSCKQDGINHAGGVCQMNTGATRAGRPSLGAWTAYGLGTENQNLPAFVVMQDNESQVVNGPRNWGPGFMPAVYQGTRIESGAEPIRNLKTPGEVGDERHRAKLALLGGMNREHALDRLDQTELAARIASFELAFRMQSEAPEAVDLSKEDAATQALYGMDDPVTAKFGRMCLLSRRLVERGVRFVQLYHGAGSKWDAHSGLEKNHAKLCQEMDKPVAGLLQDLAQRGLLEDTLVVWGGEFGRTPMSEKGDGRDHNPYGFSMWMAGAGIVGGRMVGATDDVGLHAVEDKLHVHDIHATILHLLGLHHMELVYKHKGRPERPTLNEGEPARKVVG